MMVHTTFPLRLHTANADAYWPQAKCWCHQAQRLENRIINDILWSGVWDLPGSWLAALTSWASGDRVRESEREIERRQADESTKRFSVAVGDGVHTVDIAVLGWQMYEHDVLNMDVILENILLKSVQRLSFFYVFQGFIAFKSFELFLENVFFRKHTTINVSFWNRVTNTKSLSEQSIQQPMAF